MSHAVSAVHVVAAVIRDAAGRILLSQRRSEQDMPGLWEFPGGKREPGETSIDALRRELREELGIEFVSAKPIIEVPQSYPHKRVVLETFEIGEWSGVAFGHEGQALQWVEPESLQRFAMPPADRPIVATLTQPDRYLISPDVLDNEPLLLALTCALNGGITRVQLRTPSRAAHDMQALARKAHALCVPYAANLLINSACQNAVALATELGCGLHLTSLDLGRMGERPPQAGSSLAASCHTADDLQKAERLGCGFAVLGPVAVTASHPNAKPIGWSGFRALRESVSLPIYALGGMCRNDIDIARRNGAQGIAAIRGLWPTQVSLEASFRRSNEV